MSLALLSPSTKSAAVARLNSLITAHNAKGVEVTPLGSTIANAALLDGDKFVHVVTGANGTLAVRLPVPAVGASYLVINNNGSNALPVFPNSASDIINGGSAGAAANIAALRSVLYTYVGGTVGWELHTIIVALT